MKRFLIEVWESLRIALEQIQLHKMRSILTALGVIIGIVAVTLMGTAIKGIDKGFNDSLSMIGLELFYVERFPWQEGGATEWWRFRNRKVIETRFADQFNERLSQTPNSRLVLAVPTVQTWRGISFQDRSVDGVQVLGTTGEYILTSTWEFAEGRLFTETESQSGSMVVALGHDVAEALFPGRSAVGEQVRIANRAFTVVGVFARQGDFLGMFSRDKQAVMPLIAMRKFYSGNHRNSLIVLMRSDADKQEAEDEIEGHMRAIRGIMPGAANDFEINKTETIEDQIGPIKKGIAGAGLFITGLALFVGAIGIMNITFVSVKERTHEIGTRRALGARRRSILMQFLIEAVSICLIGGVIGLLITFVLFVAISRAFPAFPMVYSPDLVGLALVVSVVTGILSGFTPALTASRLDPAEALRHE